MSRRWRQEVQRLWCPGTLIGGSTDISSPIFLYFIVLRDPIDRVGSIYDYIRARTAHRHSEKYNAATLAEVLADPTSQREHICNGQVRLLFGEERRRKPIAQQHFEAAWANLCRPDVVVTFTHRINDGLQALAQRTGLSIPPCSSVVNATTRSPLDADTVARIREQNRWDVLLYERAQERFAG